jgi:hypothetical protein
MTKTVFCLMPRPLVEIHYPTGKLHEPRCLFVGWVWLRKAKLTYNMVHGWLAFADDQELLKKASKK